MHFVNRGNYESEMDNEYAKVLRARARATISNMEYLTQTTTVILSLPNITTRYFEYTSLMVCLSMCVEAVVVCELQVQ